MRYLIVNADDFGQNAGVNAGILEAHERGIVTSASLMVRWPAAPSAATAAAAASARTRERLSLGLHVDLGEWICKDDDWEPLYSVVPLTDRNAVAAEVQQQLARFRALVGRDPTHLDSHQHVHRYEPVRGILVDLARDLNVPLRHFSPIRYCGEFYGQARRGHPFPEGISVDALIRILTALPRGYVEVGCHPGDGHDLDSMYTSERAEEVKTLCDVRVRAALADSGIQLTSFASIGQEILSMMNAER
jgi:predicted glycoside hydrolase/deacetylase ChbG (UPF0249 family)